MEGEGHGLRMDKGYDSRKVGELARAMGYTPPIRSRGEEKRALAKEEGFKAAWLAQPLPPDTCPLGKVA